MSNKRLSVILIIVALVIIGAIGAWRLTIGKPNTAQQGTSNQTNEQTADTSKSYTAAEVAQHNTATDCWTIIAGNVYDLTSYIKSHPGGDDIVRACGQDSTSLFMQRTTSDGESVGSGTPHSQSAQAQLERLKIGTLRN